MTDENNKEVKDIERVEVAPTADEELVDDPEKPGQESSPEEKPEGETPTETIETPPKTESTKVAIIVPTLPKVDEVDGIKRLADETDREFAQRLEINRLRGKLRTERTEDIVGKPPIVQQRKEISPEKKKVLDRYKPEQIAELGEVFEALADNMGFVKKDQLESQTFIQKGEEELQTFLGAHPEYLPENDPQGLNWGKFKENYGQYKPPTNAKDFKRLFEKVHRDTFGIQPKGDLGKINAAKEKITVASHTGASSPTGKTTDRPTTGRRATGLRTDMLKGFSDEEISNIESKA